MSLPNASFDPAMIGQRHVTEERRLKKRARQFMDDYPDIHTMAYAAARRILTQRTGKHLDPNQVYWHRFSAAMSSPRTFTGWQHPGPPIESMTLLELVMHRFNAVDQEASDELQLYGGFYTDGPNHDFFDERNEVALLPQDVLADFWALDFSAVFAQKMDHFWTAHSDTFRTLAEARYISSAALDLRHGRISSRDFTTVMAAIAGSAQVVMSLGVMEERITPAAGLSLRAFDIGGYVSHEVIRVVDAQDRQILYMPGHTPAFKAFGSPRELYEWVRGQVSSEMGRAVFEGFFLRSASTRQTGSAAFDALLNQIIAQPWRSDLHIVSQQDQAISGDVFSYLRDVARQEMQADAHTLLTSNASLRKQMWIGYLNAFIHAFGSLAPLGWPVALTMIGAGIVNVGLSTDQAINGNTARQRKAGVIGAICNSIYILFNLPLLAGVRSASEAGLLVEFEEGSEGTEVLDLPGENIPLEPMTSPVPEVVTSSHAALAGLEGNVVLSDATPLATSGRMQGINLLSNGETWISLNDLPYRVQYSESLQCWTLIDARNPFAFIGARPVRLNALGQWELLDSLGLRGGTPMDVVVEAATSSKSYPTLRSSFWDIYMQFNLTEEERLSALALQRQLNLTDTVEVDLEGGGYVDSDDVYTDPEGSQYRVFKNEGGAYVSSSISAYSMQDGLFNTFLRTGEYQMSNQVGIIHELADDLKQLGYNNDVPLYRGGSGQRGTSGLVFRNGQIKAGDFLVNTDITSFSENPYIARVFASSQGGQASVDFNGLITFDDTSVVFELPAKSYLSATPIGPFSGSPNEVESLMVPGHYFLVESIEEMAGESYSFIKVQLKEVDKAQSGAGLYDMRTGQPFSREEYAAMLGANGKSLVDLFFPLGGDSPVD